jgi:hypothetical protein
VPARHGWERLSVKDVAEHRPDGYRRIRALLVHAKDDEMKLIRATGFDSGEARLDRSMRSFMTGTSEQRR